MVSEHFERTESSHEASSFFDVALDRLLRLDRGDRLAWLSAVRAALRRFPNLDACDRVAVARSIAYRDAMNRVILRLQTRFPEIARIVAGVVPIAGSRDLYAAVPLDQPIVFALIHMGPIHAAMTMALRMLKGRTVYVFHAGGEHGHAVSGYFRRLGAVPVVNERGALAGVLERMAEQPASAVILCYDYLGSGGSQSVPFLGASISVATGLSRLVDATGAAVVMGWWDRSRTVPRFEIGAGPVMRRELAPADRRSAFTASMFALLESRVRKNPQDWTEWQNC